MEEGRAFRWAVLLGAAGLVALAGAGIAGGQAQSAVLLAYALWITSLLFLAPLPGTAPLAGAVLAACAAGQTALHLLFPDPAFPYAAAVLLCSNLYLFLIAVCAGRLVARLATLAGGREVVLPLLLVASLADLWSVLLGPTRVLVEKRREGVDVIRYVAFQIVAPPEPGRSAEITSFVGVADFVIAALLARLGALFGLPPWRSGLGLLLAFAAGIAAAHGLRAGIPLLPFLAVGFVAAHGRALIPPRRVALQTLAFILALTAILGACHLFFPRPGESGKTTLTPALPGDIIPRNPMHRPPR